MNRLLVAFVVVAAVLAVPTIANGQVPPVNGTITLEDGDVCTDRGYIYMACASGRAAGVPVYGYRWATVWLVEVFSGPGGPGIERLRVTQCTGLLQGEDWTQDDRPLVQVQCPLDDQP
jgi:hypothetical protein